MKRLFFLLSVLPLFLASAWNPYQSFQPQKNAFLANSVQYHYGYPAYTLGGTQPNVVGQWTFDEASTQLVDKVSSITLVEEKSGAGAITYQQPITGIYAGLSPGVKYSPRLEATHHTKTTATVSLDAGTGDFTREIWFSIDSSFVSASTQYVFSLANHTATTSYELYYFVWSGSQLQFESDFLATDATTFQCNKNSPSINDGQPHKMRIQAIRAGNINFVLDGVSLGTCSMATLSGKTLSNQGVSTMIFNTGVITGIVNLYELRLSNNGSNNSGGPGGG